MALTDDQLRSMTAEQLHDLLIEEAAEVIHAVSKAKRFGLENGHASYNGGRSNADAIAREMHQLHQTFRIYCGKVGMNYGDTLENPDWELSSLARASVC